MCPITLDIIPTKINIATDISNDIEFNSMIGFTHKEVDSLLNEVVEEKNKREEIKNIMIKNYGGYLFNKNATEKVFTATLVMYLLRFYESYKKIPEELFIITMGINSKKNWKFNWIKK